jgi:hypothetical protein
MRTLLLGMLIASPIYSLPCINISEVINATDYDICVARLESVEDIGRSIRIQQISSIDDCTGIPIRAFKTLSNAYDISYKIRVPVKIGLDDVFRCAVVPAQTKVRHTGLFIPVNQSYNSKTFAQAHNTLMVCYCKSMEENYVFRYIKVNEFNKFEGKQVMDYWDQWEQDVEGVPSYTLLVVRNTNIPNDKMFMTQNKTICLRQEVFNVILMPDYKE